MAKIFKPRRALRSSVKSGSKRTLVLASGELMMVGKSAIGEGSKADLYLGDGVSQIQNLSPAMYGDTSEEDMTITDDTSTTASAALGNVTTGKTLGAILGSLKKAISLNASAIATLNDDLAKETIISIFARYTDKYDLNIIFNEQRNNSVIFIGGQHELNCPDNFKGNLHIIISYRYNQSYGIQFGFAAGILSSRALGPSGWNNWVEF